MRKAEEERKRLEEEARKKKEEEEIHRWWEANGAGMGDDEQKWTTLVHSGVMFAPPYEPLPKNVKMKYNGNIHLSVCVIAFLICGQASLSTCRPPPKRWLASTVP